MTGEFEFTDSEYTDNSGNQWGARGGPSVPGVSGGNTTAQSGISNSRGTIATVSGPYGPTFKDYDFSGTNPRETVKTGSDLSADWQKIKDAFRDIGNEGHQYRPVDQNSNTTVDEALRRSNVQELGVVERFMGFTYAGASGQARLTPLDAGSGSIAVSLAANDYNYRRTNQQIK